MSGKKPRSIRRVGGSALVVILLLVVLFSTIILAYFSRAQLQRQISTSSAGQSRANFLAQAALESIKGDMLDEIRAGSTIRSMTNGTVYVPLTNYFMVPQRVGDKGITNLVKVSTSSSPMWKSANGRSYNDEGPLRSVMGNSTTNKSLGGRAISSDRWLAPLLVGTNESLNMPSPDWIIVTRQGPITAAKVPSMAELADKTPANSNYAVGRYAYAVYDEGGLMDVTAAGYPSSGSDLTSEQISRKGFLALADLKQIPNGSDKLTQAQIDGLVTWRNSSTKNDYYEHLTTYGATNGFLLTKPGDQSFVTRQDLIRYARLNQFEGALPYLTTFTRAKTAPSWYPRYNAAELGGNDGTGGVYAYKDQAEQVTSVNRNLLMLRDTIGEPLLKTRFPLSRIGLLSVSVPDSAAIQTHFGLSRVGVKWAYSQGSPDRIFTLEEVKAAGRKPDFFELLKASILSGSIGHVIGGTYSNPPLRSTAAQAQDDHVIQIGVNILDQYDAGNVPTIVTFNGREFSGSENLPYLMRVLSYVYEEPAGTINTWWQPELWRPYQDISAVATGGRDDSPANIRIQATGKSATEWSDGTSLIQGSTVDYDLNPSLGRIEFPTSQIPRNRPIALTTAQGATSPNSDNIKSWATNPMAAISSGHASYSPTRPSSPPEPPLVFQIWVYPFISKKVSIQLQCLQADGAWYTYSGMDDLLESNAGAIGGSARNGIESYQIPSGRKDMPYLFFGRSDPRTDRFGASIGDTGSSKYFPSLTLRPGYQEGYQYLGWLPNAPNMAATPSLGLLSDNKTTSSMRYSDPDGVLRPAAGAYTLGNGGTDGYPLISANDVARPIIINRPFQSVGELGYTYRDLPWKELDFFTQQSADAALLDVFSVYEEPEVVAGRVSLSSARPEVLQSILVGAGRKESQAGLALDTEVSGVAEAIRNQIADHGALLNRSELVTECSNALTPALTSNVIQRNKTQREAVVRALTDVSDTRTWNLMVDVIAQVGRYTSNSASLNDFIVEGEKRYWLHVSIDRFTGEVVDQQLEAVSE